MYGETCYTLALGSFYQRAEQSERIHLRLQIIVEQRLKRRHFGVHNHNVRRDTIFAQRHTLVGYRHRQIVGTVVLQRLGYFYCAGTIAVGLNHTHQLCFGLHERTIVVQVSHHSTKVYLKGGFVHLLHQQFG